MPSVTLSGAAAESAAHGEQGLLVPKEGSERSTRTSDRLGWGARDRRRGAGSRFVLGTRSAWSPSVRVSASVPSTEHRSLIPELHTCGSLTKTSRKPLKQCGLTWQLSLGFQHSSCTKAHSTALKLCVCGGRVSESETSPPENLRCARHCFKLFYVQSLIYSSQTTRPLPVVYPR